MDGSLSLTRVRAEANDTLLASGRFGGACEDSDTDTPGSSDIDLGRGKRIVDDNGE